MRGEEREGAEQEGGGKKGDNEDKSAGWNGLTIMKGEYFCLYQSCLIGPSIIGKHLLSRTDTRLGANQSLS